MERFTLTLHPLATDDLTLHPLPAVTARRGGRAPDLAQAVTLGLLVVAVGPVSANPDLAAPPETGSLATTTSLMEEFNGGLGI